jgi:DNA polymerase
LEQLGRIIDLTDDEAKAHVAIYRSVNADIVSCWRIINTAALAAVNNPGRFYLFGVDDKAGFIREHNWLWMVLPTGRMLAYHRPEVEVTDGPFGPREQVVFWGRNSYTKKWQRRHGYGGLWTENVVQALARDLLADAMLRVRRRGYKLVLTVHDEIVVEVRNGTGSLQQFLDVMSEVPLWATGCPVAVEGFETTRYRKG